MFRITFSRNEIVAIKPLEGDYHLDGNSFYYEHEGRLIYAIVRANTEDAAFLKAVEIVKEVRLGKRRTTDASA